MAKPTFSGTGKGVYECQEGDLCQTELYNYGEVSASVFFPISNNPSPLFLGKINTNEDLFRSYPVMEDERWCLTNSAKTETFATLHSLKGELKQAYCESRKLDVDRMGCD